MAKATVIFTKTCIFCNKVTTIEVDAKKFQRWRDGEHVQNVFSELLDFERELMISGTCNPCWTANFADPLNEG